MQAIRISRLLPRVATSVPGGHMRHVCRPMMPLHHVGTARYVAVKAWNLSAEDRMEIMELCHRFDHAINRLDQQAVGNMFTSAAQLHTPKGVIEGSPAIVAFFKSVEPMAMGNRHLTVDIVIDPVDSTSSYPAAKVSAYRLLHKATTPSTILNSGTISDDLVKVDGKWKFAARRFVMDPKAE